MALSSSTEDLQRAKEIVQSYHNALGLEDGANEERVKEALKTHYSPEVSKSAISSSAKKTGPQFW